MENATPMQEAITVAARAVVVADSREREIMELQAELARVKAAAEVDARIVAALWATSQSEWGNWQSNSECDLFRHLQRFGPQPPIPNLTLEQKAQILRVLEAMI